MPLFRGFPGATGVILLTWSIETAGTESYEFFSHGNHWLHLRIQENESPAPWLQFRISFTPLLNPSRINSLAKHLFQALLFKEPGIRWKPFS
jgi:hypothetical protein